MRCGLNVDPAPGAEESRWKELNRRRDEVRRHLLVMAAGHPSPAVSSAAKRLEVELFTAAVQSEWHVADLLKNRDNREQLGSAQEKHESAVAVCDRLEKAVKAAAGD